MNNKLCHNSSSLVSISSVPEQQGLHILEFQNTKISSQSSLLTFLTNNTYTNISSLNHTNIITTITN